MNNIIVIGGGSWGTAFGNYLAAFKKEPIKLWMREPEIIDSIATKRENHVFLPGITLSPYLIPTADLVPEVEAADIVLLVVPSKFMRQTLMQLRGSLDNKLIVNLSKGFEASSLKTMSQLAAEILGPEILNRWVTISGPSFARELAANHPTAVVAGSRNQELLEKIQGEFSSDILRIYRTDDLAGIEVAGSIKNVMAIASGIVKGCGFGYNTTATLITRASMEISRFGLKMDARKETFWGLAGIGDLMLTCFGPLSRNFQLGERIAKGESLEHIEKSSAMIAEGVETTKAVQYLSKKMAIEMPISHQVYRILFDHVIPGDALKELMKRSLKIEWNLN